jgi:hypothetical protein
LACTTGYVFRFRVNHYTDKGTLTMILTVATLHNNSVEQYNNFRDTVQRIEEDPISLDKMRDPIVIQCGHVFDRTSFLEHAARTRLSDEGVTCPKCRVQVDENIMIPNLTMREVVPIVAKLDEEATLALKENEALKKQIAVANKQLAEANRCCLWNIYDVAACCVSSTAGCVVKSVKWVVGK